MLKIILKPFICFFKWHLSLFDLQKLRLETAKKYSLPLDEHDIAEKIYKIWKWIGIFFSFSSYILIPIYLALKYFEPSSSNIIFHFIGYHLLFFGFYLICNSLQSATMDDDIREYKEFYEKYKDFL